MMNITQDNQVDIINETLDFILSAPSLEAVRDHQASPAAQQRLRQLLELERDNMLSRDEKVELDTIMRFNHVMSLLKIRAHSRTQSEIANGIYR